MSDGHDSCARDSKFSGNLTSRQVPVILAVTNSENVVYIFISTDRATAFRRLPTASEFNWALGNLSGFCSSFCLKT